jgi:potassium channel subfamily K protein 1
MDKVMPFLNNKFTAASNTSQRILSRSHMHASFTITCTLVVLVFLFLIPAAIYSHIEGWSYLNSFYYCFISLSTVGLGDYVPGDSSEQSHRHLYKIASTVYLIGGVMVMIWLLQIYSETPDFNIYKYFTLVKDGILTRHRDTVHGACSYTSQSANINLNNQSTVAAASAANSSVLSETSQINYQRQLDESGQQQKAQNYEATNLNK